VATAPVTDAALVPHLFREFDDRGIELAEFTLRKASLDEVFLALTGRRADDEEPGHRDLEESSR
jgi:oleandomycin transport system ATP-binding protein